MKFEDLDFKPHYLGGVQAKHNFPNGYGVSVIQGHFTYTDGPNEWEVGIFHHGKLCYGSGITDEVIGHQTRADIDQLLERVEALPKADLGHSCARPRWSEEVKS